MSTRNPAPPSRSRVTLAVSALAAMVLVGACTGDTPDPAPSGSGSASPTASATPSFVPSDQSAKVLSSQLPAVQGSATGIVSKEAATLNVADVKATAGGTLLTYWFTGAETSLLGDQGEKSWENLPTLVDVPGEKIYEPFTFTHNRGETFCLCTDATYVRWVPQPRTIYYPALPDTVTTIEVRQVGFDQPITVPVTR